MDATRLPICLALAAGLAFPATLVPHGSARASLAPAEPARPAAREPKPAQPTKPAPPTGKSDADDLADILGEVAPEKEAAPAEAPIEETAEEKTERAKVLFGEGAKLQEEGKYGAAVEKYREAYLLAPERHVFNFNIGMALYEAKNCAEAEKVLQDFLAKVPDKPDLRSSAEKVLADIEKSGCARPAEASEGPAASDEESPLLESRREQRKRAAAHERRMMDLTAKGPMFKAGIALTVIGGAALATAIVTWGLALGKGLELKRKASPGPTGYPQGSYADSETFRADRQLKRLNAVTLATVTVGAAALATGVALLLVDRKRRGKGPTATLTPAWTPGGGGAVASLAF